METLEAAPQLLDEQFVALSHVQRRRLLLSLLEGHAREDPRVDVHELADGAERQEFLIEMCHRHLPALEDQGFIRWNQEGMTVAAGPQFQEIRPLLELLDDHRDELPADVA